MHVTQPSKDWVGVIRHPREEIELLPWYPGLTLSRYPLRCSSKTIHFSWPNYSTSRQSKGQGVLRTVTSCGKRSGAMPALGYPQFRDILLSNLESPAIEPWLYIQCRLWLVISVIELRLDTFLFLRLLQNSKVLMS